MSPSPYLPMLQFIQIKVKLQCNDNNYLKQINFKKKKIIYFGELAIKIFN